MEGPQALDSDSGSSNRRTALLRAVMLAVALGCILFFAPNSDSLKDSEIISAAPGSITPASGETFASLFSGPFILLFAALLMGSAFFSSSEIAFFSLDGVRLRSMREQGGFLQRHIVEICGHPARLLTTILVGNMFMNVLIGVLLGTRVERYFAEALHLSTPPSYILAILLTTGILIIFGEIVPKILAIRIAVPLAKVSVIPMTLADRLFAPIRTGLMWLTNVLFRVTRFDTLRAAPFITDEEFITVLYDGEKQGVIEVEERQMIEGILEFRDAVLREILVPRPDVVALEETATVRDALTALRAHNRSRMPIYRENLDHITGLLVVKDMLGRIREGDLDACVKTLARPMIFVPETMTIDRFVKEAKRARTHMAVVVDEYGGTEGIVTLHDAIEEVVGEIGEGQHEETPYITEISKDVYDVDGSVPLDELNTMLEVSIEDEEHETLGGFFMNQSEKVPEVGDAIEYDGARFTVREVDGKRVSVLRVDLSSDRNEDAIQ